jgi:hypothetical protein
VATGAFVSNFCVCALFIFFYLGLLPCVRAVERQEKGEHRERVFPVETNKLVRVRKNHPVAFIQFLEIVT